MRPWYEKVIGSALRPIEIAKWVQYQRSRIEKDIKLVTLPSSGTYWLRLMLVRTIIQAYELDEQINGIKLDTIIPTYRDKKLRFKYNDNLTIPRIQHGHSFYSSFFYRNTNVVLLVRDLRDTLASHYRIHTRVQEFDGNFSDFLRGNIRAKNKHFLLQDRIDFLNSWSRNFNKLNSYMVVRYEDLKIEPHSKLEEICNFCGIEGVSESIVRDAVEFCSVENMRALEQQNPIKSYVGKTTKVSDGKTGGYRSLFSDSDLDYFNQMVSDRLLDTFGYDYEQD